MTPLAVFGIFAAAVAAVAVSQFLLAGASFQTFNPYGVNAAIAIAAIQAMVIVIFARVDPSSRTIRNLVLLHIVVIAFTVILAGPVFQALALDDPKTYASPSAAIGVWFYMLVLTIWFAGGARQAFRTTPGVRRPALRAALFTIVSIVSPMALPNWPIVASAHFDSSTANLWEVARRYQVHASNRRTRRRRAGGSSSHRNGGGAAGGPAERIAQ